MLGISALTNPSSYTTRAIRPARNLAKSRQFFGKMLRSKGSHRPFHDEESPSRPASRIHASSPERWKIPLIGLEPTPELSAISLVYFVQGILGLSRLAVSFYYKDELHLDPAQVSVLAGITTIPWLIKPVYGFISDSIPIFGYRRRSYLLLCGLLGAGAWFFMSSGPDSPSKAVAALALASLSTACSDVVVDSLVVERARHAPSGTTGSLQSLCWASSAVGGIISAYFSGSLVQHYGPRSVFLVTAALPLLTAFSSVLIDEKRALPTPLDLTKSEDPTRRDVESASPGVARPLLMGADREGSSGDIASASYSGAPSFISALARTSMFQRVLLLWGALKQKDILYPALFLFIWQATPTSDSAMFYFQTNQLQFDAEFLGRVRLVGSVAALLGVGLYNTYLKKVQLTKIFFWTSVTGSCLSLTQLLLVTGLNRQLGLSDQLFCLGDSLVLTVLGQISFMPVLVLAAKICPVGVEATLFAALMSVLNGGGAVGGLIGAALTSYLGVTADKFDNLALLVGICGLSALLPLPLLSLVPANVDSEDPSEEDRGDDSSNGGGGGGGGRVGPISPSTDPSVSLRRSAAAAAAAGASNGNGVGNGSNAPSAMTALYANTQSGGSVLHMQMNMNMQGSVGAGLLSAEAAAVAIGGGVQSMHAEVGGRGLRPRGGAAGGGGSGASSGASGMASPAGVHVVGNVNGGA